MKATTIRTLLASAAIIATATPPLPAIETIFDFTGPGDSLDIYPAGNLILGTDGALYGMTQGATDNAGTVYRVTTAGSVTTLVSFPEIDESPQEELEAMGAALRGSLVRGSDGNLYGSASSGGVHGYGTIFRVTPTGDFAKLVDFSGTAGNARGASPQSELFLGTDGFFYGTTRGGGIHDQGVVFRMSASGTMETLLDFTGTSGPRKGSSPSSGVVQAPDGNFYGTTFSGGAADLGTIFKMTPAGALTTLVEFSGEAGAFKGAYPAAQLAVGADGNLYGTTWIGGTNDRGTVFRVTPQGSFTTLIEFTGTAGSSPGSFPADPLLLDVDGNFYGTTAFGGLEGSGTVFKMTPSGQILFRLNAWDFGVEWPSGLVDGADGKFYGAERNYPGGVFSVTPEGTAEKIVESGEEVPDPGELTSLIDGQDGYLYGTTTTGGAAKRGTIYRISTGGDLTTLAEFTGEGPASGQAPNSLVRTVDGTFYGTTERGGDHNLGTVFRMTPDGSLSTLHHFLPSDAHFPDSLILGPSGEFFGTTSYNIGALFKVTPAGQFQTLVTFTGETGAQPGRGPNRLLFATDGNFYGATRFGGAHGGGTIFKMTPAGTMTLLHHFDGSGGAATSTVPWKSLPIKPQTGTFTLTFNITPNAALMDGVTGLCLGQATAYRDLACAVRFNSSGFIDVRNGGVYSADSNLGYQPGTTYAISMTVNMGTKRYGVSVNGTPIATNYSFRTEQANTATLDHIALRNESNIHPGDHSLTAVSLTISGHSPQAGLVEGSDGILYGTTSMDAIGERGAFFSITKAGNYTELGQLATAEGGQSTGQIFAAPDGTFFGTTGLEGGEFGYGSIFRAKTDGSIVNEASFPRIRIAYPEDPLVIAADGSIYGIGSSGSGFIYRIPYPGFPVISDIGEDLMAASGTLLMQGKFNARGLPTSIYLDYGPSETPVPPTWSFPFTESVGLANGSLESLLGTTLTGLIPGKTYYYRYRATNSVGTSTSPVRSFVSSGPPQLTLFEESDVDSNSARLHGEVNAGNLATTVVFEYGQSPEVFPNSETANTMTGNVTSPVTVVLSQLTSGVPYYYRLRASNALGTVVSGTRSFVTLSAPAATVGAATLVSTTRARVEGTVDPKGAVAKVFFDYREKGTVPFSTEQIATQTISGNGAQPVSVVLRNLDQGKTYQYRVRATVDNGSGGTLEGISDPREFTLTILSGLFQSFPQPPPPTTGMLTVLLDPPDIGGWRLAGEQKWRASGETATGLATGDRRVEYRPVPGSIHPPDEIAGVVSGEAATVLERDYFLSAEVTSGTGSLLVTLKPDAVANGAGQWRLLGETSESQWQNSGTTRIGLVPGNYLIECKPVSNRVTPVPASVQVTAGPAAVLTLTYLLPPATTGTPLSVLPFNEVSANEDQPFAYVGQIRSNTGSGSGFVVKRRVVATAGHVVFDDGTLSSVTGLQWLLQRHAGTYEPVPQVPRGFYMSQGYATARSQPGVIPGEGTTDSQHHDFAALYFLEDAARGGFGGFLASEGTENEFMTSNAEKILAGYAIDGVTLGDRGKLHATPAAPFTLERVPGLIGGLPYGTYRTSAVAGRSGASGGPLFVRHGDEGLFYPAAIYLGGSGQTVVRAIDRTVVDLFNSAETSGNGGGNNTSGGISHTSVTSLAGTTSRGALRVILLPENLAGRSWQLLPSEIVRSSGDQRTNLRPGDYRISIASVPGYQLPSETTVNVKEGELTTLTYTYAALPSSLETWRQANFGAGATNAGAAADGADPDGDGWKNIDEYAAGTNPNSAADVLRVLTSHKSATSFTVTARGKSGRTYTLERRDRLDTGSWTPVDGEGPLTTDTTPQAPLVLIDTSPPAGRAFYRISVSVP